mmetsp:Transcript_10160/g.32306  ORF Transcript_10160/g.32306 Transcript_10160/m.32306 type:complete len:133 (-) Transcript_10160:1390-1788(-)
MSFRPRMGSAGPSGISCQALLSARAPEGASRAPPRAAASIVPLSLSLSLSLFLPLTLRLLSPFPDTSPGTFVFFFPMDPLPTATNHPWPPLLLLMRFGLKHVWELHNPSAESFDFTPFVGAGSFRQVFSESL